MYDLLLQKYVVRKFVALLRGESNVDTIGMRILLLERYRNQRVMGRMTPWEYFAARRRLLDSIEGEVRGGLVRNVCGETIVIVARAQTAVDQEETIWQRRERTHRAKWTSDDVLMTLVGYFCDERELPKRLKSLVPRYLPAVPEDEHGVSYEEVCVFEGTKVTFCGFESGVGARN